MVKHTLNFITMILLSSVVFTSPVMAMICMNGTQQLTCTGTPSVCPQGQTACSSAAYSVSGGASITSTNVLNKNGFKRIESTGTGLISFFAWACTASGCTETDAGSLTVVGGDLSGLVSTNQITSINGNGENLDFYNGSTLVGSITISGSIITGSASASNGLLSVNASGTILAFTGMNCSGTNCAVSSAGIINIAGISYSCPLGKQYQCGNIGNGYFCSNISCFDETAGGTVPSGAQVCAKDLNGNGAIDQNEILPCTAVNGGMFCPIDTMDCNTSYQCASGTYNSSRKRCEITGITQCPKGMTYDSANAVCYSAATVIYTCPYGSQYTCLPNPSTGTQQCSDLSCFIISSQQTQTSTADTTSYQNDGTVDSTGKCLGQIYIFNGKPSKCRPSGISTAYFNCCDTDPGKFLFIQNHCGNKEALTVKKIAKKQCHYVGNYCQQKLPVIGCVQKANMYCCFGSELGRIIQEQGRPQLIAFNANGWGTPKNPDCRGFTPEEFQHLDFSKIDLSEFINDMVVASQATISSKVKTGLQNYINNLNK
ncbi:MAG: conjugal transfer protein TraN [Syntrophaceae bacterium]